MKNNLFVLILILASFVYSSCSNGEECKCVGAESFSEDDCDCNVSVECNNLKALGQDCKVE